MYTLKIDVFYIKQSPFPNPSCLLIPWKSNHHFLWVGFRTTIILVGVYHHPKGTTIFKMVVDFQGIHIESLDLSFETKLNGRYGHHWGRGRNTVESSPFQTNTPGVWRLVVVFHQPIWKILARQIGSFPQVVRNENAKKHLKPPAGSPQLLDHLLLTINHIQSGSNYSIQSAGFSQS